MFKITDISSNNGQYTIGSYSEDGAIIKATQGTTYINPLCDSSARQMYGKGKPWGLYHYASGGDPVKEADFFVQTIGHFLDDKSCIVVLDWEKIQNSVFGSTTWCSDFITRVKEKTGLTCVLYTGLDGINQNRSLINKIPLWFAGYPRSGDVGWNAGNFPYNTSGWIVSGWQFTDTPIDKSYFYQDTLDQWSALSRGGGITQAPKKDLVSPAGDIDDKVEEVYQGIHGVGDERKASLGGWYEPVQAVLDFYGGVTSEEACIENLKDLTLQDFFSTGDTRKRMLGTFYARVQDKLG